MCMQIKKVAGMSDGSISVSRLVAYLLGICKRFNLDPEKLAVLINGKAADDMTYISLEIMDDGAMVSVLDDDGDTPLRDKNGLMNLRAWVDDDGCADELYRCIWIAIRQK